MLESKSASTSSIPNPHHVSDYWKEEEKKNVIARDFGFVTYSISGRELFVCDLYIEPKYRKRPQSYKLLRDLEAVARVNGCNVLTGNTFFQKNGETFTRNVKVMIQCGFIVLSMGENRITWVKKLEE